MSRYADILKKSNKEEQQPISNGDERITVVDAKPVYRCEQPPPKRRHCNYDRWEYAYFPHLIEMYRILCDGDTEWNPPEMHQFFQFIYYVSSGEISEYLENPTEAYFEYLIKRNDS